MKFNGALVQLEDMVIAVAVDSADFLSLQQRISKDAVCDAA